MPLVNQLPTPDGKAPEKRKAPPLDQELTAKTVPLRSAAPPLPPRSTIPVTAPLPTKPIFQPQPGKVPPPSVVSALTKKLGKETPPAVEQPPIVKPDPVQDLMDEVKTAKIPPPVFKGKQAKSKDAKDGKKADAKAKTDATLDPAQKSTEAKKPLRIFPILITAAAALAALMLYYVWSPYHAAAGLRAAFNNGDAAELDARVDFPAVRDSLKAQIHAQLGRSGFQDADTVAMIDRSIDLYVTPDGISALVKTPDSIVKSDQGAVVSSSVASNLLVTLNTEPVNSQGLSSLTDFVLDRSVAFFHLQFQGLGWKLTNIDIRPDLQVQAPSDSAVPFLSPVVDSYLEQGNGKLKNSDWTGAIADFSKVLTVNPRSSVAYNDRGTARYSMNDFDGAIKDFTQALTLDPNLASAYNGRGNAKAGKNDLDGAIADYTQAIHFDPTLAVAYDSRGNVKTNKDDLDGAIADYTQAIALDPNLASAYSDRGFARQANGNLDGAITDYTQVLALKPKMAMTYYNRGLARQSQGNFDVAIVDFDHALAFNPKMSAAYYSRGNAKNAVHDADGAIADYTQAVALNPKYALAFNNRGMVRQAKGDLDGAITDYTQALALDPKIATAYFNKGQIEGQRNDLDGAIADSTQALYLDPKNAAAYNTRGFAKLAKGNLDGALADLTQFCDLSPRDHDADHARLYLWLIAKAQGKPDPDTDLSTALETSWNSPADDLVSKTAAFLLGRMNEADYLAAAASSDTKVDQAPALRGAIFRRHEAAPHGRQEGRDRCLPSMHRHRPKRRLRICPRAGGTAGPRVASAPTGPRTRARGDTCNARESIAVIPKVAAAVP